MSKQFSPSNYPKWFKLKYQGTFDYKFIERYDIPNIIDRIFSKLHHLGSHSYQTKRWKRAEQRLLNNHHMDRF